MLQAQKLTKSYGANTVLKGAGFILNSGEHAGLIGPNGAGKTTLLRLLTGQELPDSGSLTLTPKNLRIGYLAQSLDVAGDITVSEAMRLAGGDLARAEIELQQAAEALAGAEDAGSAMQVYDEALARFEALGGYGREHSSEAILQGLGLGDELRDANVASLSGGQKTRLGLALLLLREPDLLLLDEPTNHLDVAALEWLETFVQGYSGAALIVSHDREFLDSTVTRILYLDPDARTVKSYAGNYSDFEAAREQERQAQSEAWTRQQEYIGKVKGDIARLKGEALQIELGTTPRQPAVRKLAKRKAQIAKSREHKLERYLSDDARIGKPSLSWWLKLDFGTPPPSGKSVLTVDNMSFAYPDGPELFNDVSLTVRYGERIALVGPNGTGKSTLLKLIEGTLQPNSGGIRLGTGVRLGRLAQEQETLDPKKTVLESVFAERSMSETEARNFLHFFLFEGDEPLKLTGECSLGQRSRLQLALLVLRGCNLLLLDEPLNHLDIEGREHFRGALEAFEGTVILVAHDRAFLHVYPERVIEVAEGRLRIYEGYDDYLTRREPTTVL